MLCAMKLTLQIKLLPDPGQEKALLETVKACNRAANTISEYAFRNRIFKRFRIHRGTYRQIKGSPGLSSQATVRAIARVADAYQADRKRLRRFRLLGAISYDARLLSYRREERTASLWMVRGRMRMPFLCHNPSLLGRLQGEADLLYRRGKWFLLQTVDLPEPQAPPSEGFLGVDLGIENLATTSDGERFSGKAVDDARERLKRIKSALQSHGSKSAKRHPKRLSGREARFKRQVHHLISKRIVSLAKDTRRGIALEQLKGLRVTVRKADREHFGKWAFGQLWGFIEYKGRVRGVEVLAVDPRHSSQECSDCGYSARRNRRSQALFLCHRCGFCLHADHNAARNLAQRAAVNRPIAVHVEPPTPTLLGTAMPRQLAR